MKILKMFRESDLYTGMIVASSQNEIHLYELDLTDASLRYKAIGFINDAGVVEKYEEGSWFSTNLYNDIWCETEDSRRMDPACIREDRLKELGI
jgi:hypothetical protein